MLFWISFGLIYILSLSLPWLLVDGTNWISVQWMLIWYTLFIHWMDTIFSFIQFWSLYFFYKIWYLWKKPYIFHIYKFPYVSISYIFEKICFDIFVSMFPILCYIESHNTWLSETTDGRLHLGWRQRLHPRQRHFNEDNFIFVGENSLRRWLRSDQ